MAKDAQRINGAFPRGFAACCSDGFRKCSVDHGTTNIREGSVPKYLAIESRADFEIAVITARDSRFSLVNSISIAREFSGIIGSSIVRMS
jgi:hypothetical protein